MEEFLSCIKLNSLHPGSWRMQLTLPAKVETGLSAANRHAWNDEGRADNKYSAFVKVEQG